jgi:hypothetical protein
MKVQVGDRVKVITKNNKKSFELPMVIQIKQDDLVLQRRKKKGTITIPMNRFYELDKAFRGAKYECIITAKI